MEAIKKKMAALKIEKDNALDKMETAETQLRSVQFMFLNPTGLTTGLTNQGREQPRGEGQGGDHVVGEQVASN